MFKIFFIYFFLTRDIYEFVAITARQLDSPWLALLEFSSAKRCGGALIRDKFILTAAHCFDDVDLNDDAQRTTLKEQTKVILGEWRTDRDPECSSEVVIDYENADVEKDPQSCERTAEIPISKIVLHENYNKDMIRAKFKADIAVIVLSWAPRKSDLISNIELPDADRCNNELAQEVWTFTGFGEIPSQGFAKFKKKITLDMLTNQVCHEYFQKNNISSVNDNVICGIGRNKATTCTGDSGSAATRQASNGEIYIEGVLSFGADVCKDQTFPSAFTKVSCFIDWIKKHTIVTTTTTTTTTTTATTMLVEEKTTEKLENGGVRDDYEEN